MRPMRSRLRSGGCNRGHRTGVDCCEILTGRPAVWIGWSATCSRSRGWRLAAPRPRSRITLSGRVLVVDDEVEMQRALRPTTRAGVIVVSVMPGEKDKVRALDAGADDYVVKPFGTDELVARIRAVLRRQADVSAGESVIRTGDLEIDLARRSVTVGGRIVKLTPTEYELLRYLTLHAGKPVTHTTLLGQVCGRADPQEARRRSGQSSAHRQRAW